MPGGYWWPQAGHIWLGAAATGIGGGVAAVRAETPSFD
jgi:hypothetical protein